MHKVYSDADEWCSVVMTFRGDNRKKCECIHEYAQSSTIEEQKGGKENGKPVWLYSCQHQRAE